MLAGRHLQRNRTILIQHAAAAVAWTGRQCVRHRARARRSRHRRVPARSRDDAFDERSRASKDDGARAPKGADGGGIGAPQTASRDRTCVDVRMYLAWSESINECVPNHQHNRLQDQSAPPKSTVSDISQTTDITQNQADLLRVMIQHTFLLT